MLLRVPRGGRMAGLALVLVKAPLKRNTSPGAGSLVRSALNVGTIFEISPFIEG
jgi:hypothetical protein